MKNYFLFLLFWFLSLQIISVDAYSPKLQGTPVEKLSTLSYKVTQLSATEQPYDNPYWDNYKKGIYVDIITGTPLFSSLDKYDSGTGWPTFSKPIFQSNLSFLEDTEIGEVRTEVRAKRSGSHLGHLFDDGPAEYDGVRYCINSAALRFVPYENMRKEWYGAYLRLFR